MRHNIALFSVVCLLFHSTIIHAQSGATTTNEDAYGRDLETNTPTFEPYKFNYALGSINRDGNGEKDAKLQISFLTMFKAYERSDNVFNLGFNYTQRSFDDLADPSFPITSTDYMPGLFLSYQTRKRTRKVFRQAMFGWEHQSNGEFDTEVDRGNGIEVLNRGWDRLYIDIVFGAGKPILSNINKNKVDSNSKNYENVKFVRMGSDRVNFRIRYAKDIAVSVDNPDISDFYGLYEFEASIRWENVYLGVLHSKGRKKSHTEISLATKFVPGLGHLNESLDSKLNCQSSSRNTITHRVGCIARYLFAPFDLKDNHGAWMIEYFDGYGEHIRDYNLKAGGKIRMGYRFSFL